MKKEDIINVNNYEISAVVPIDKAGEFFMSALGLGGKDNKKNKFLLPLIMLVMGMMGGYVGILIARQSQNMQEVGNSGLQMAYAIIAFFPLIVVHELLHAVAYKYYGAPKVGFGASLKAMIVYAYAQNFPTNMRQLKWIALLPFIVITAVLLLALYIFPYYKALIIMLLLIHTLACIGDFALVKYAIQNPEHITWDDIEDKKEMYFYKPKK
jgi:hypothetical protein